MMLGVGSERGSGLLFWNDGDAALNTYSGLMCTVAGYHCSTSFFSVAIYVLGRQGPRFLNMHGALCVFLLKSFKLYLLQDV